MSSHKIIPDFMIEKLCEIMQYVGETNEWMVVKKQLLRTLPPEHRTLFSRRDEKTKKQHPNILEHEIIEWWFEKTGIQLTYPK